MELNNTDQAVVEIIETYWNVNTTISVERLNNRIEIIETYWNVNHIGMYVLAAELAAK